MERGAGGNREKKTEVLPEHQKLHMQSQKRQSLRDEQRNHLKTARDCEEEMQTLTGEWKESTVRDALPSVVGKVGRLLESGSRVGK